MNGDVQFGNTNDWLNQIVTALKPEGMPSDGDSDSGFDSAFNGVNANAPVEELTYDNWDVLCPDSKSKLCVIALFDGAQPKEITDANIAALQETRSKKRRSLCLRRFSDCGCC